ncbi:AAA family ATPase [Candidatus Uhrbacteria bacterium]|nr:AAA family ATPase [Candidatus Uhrbacteria bacterium]
MFLQKLEVQGFKSFAEKTTFLFPARKGDTCGITAIIGPNGSGKSNIADGVRWVLGEQSLKLLRSKRAEDVIFFGSGQKAQKGFCEVSLFFNNDDHAIPLDTAEVVITRRLFRDGASEYLLNRNKVRLSDIILLLAQAQMAQRSYSVIGQGMIDTILQTPPSERKEFFDEAVGVRQYQIKKDSALSKLKSTNENLNTAELVLRELEPKMKFFTRQLKRLEEREEIEKELRGHLVAYYNTVWNDLESRRDGFAHERDALQKTVDRLTKEQDACAATFAAEEKKAHLDDGGSFQDLQQSLATMQNERQQIMTRLSVLEGRLQTDLIKTGKGQLAWLTQKHDELRASAGRASDDRAALTADMAVLEKQEQALLSEYTASEDEKPEAADDDTRFEHMLSLIDAALALNEEGMRSTTPLEKMRELFSHLKDRLAAMKAYLANQVKRYAVRGEHDASIKKRTALSEEIRALGTRKEVLKERLRLRSEEEWKINAEIEQIARELEYFAASDQTEQQRALMLEKEERAGRRDILEKEIAAVQRAVDSLYDKEKEKGRRLLELQKELTALGREQEGYQQELTKRHLEIAKLEAHLEELLQKICDDLHVEEATRDEIIQKTETPVSVLGFSKNPDPIVMDETRSAIERLKRKVEQIGTIDEGLVSEHEETKQRYEFLTAQVADLQSAKESLRTAIDELEAIIRDRFEKNLEGISKKFTHYFQQLFGGGTARICIVRQQREEAESGEEENDDSSPSSSDEISGIEIEATPPGKKFKSLGFLSGGEKTLTAIALLCAILAQNPSPFVILDEVDAALDESNANRFAEIIKDLSSQTQFILITHNRVTMHIGDVLYGITMGTDGISHTLSLDIGSLDGIV